MSGEDVETIQMMLEDMNTFYNFNKQERELPVTGYFGDRTRRAVTWFQLFVGLSPADGMVDRRTFNMIKARYSNYLISIMRAAPPQISR
jgi:peptidoglycan hydrolase-like protein with peptidoglycan-binding domain